MVHFISQNGGRFFLYFILFTRIIFAASTGKITGYVNDSQTGMSLPGANVILMGVTVGPPGTATDAKGRFVLSPVPFGEYTLKITYIGYQTETFDVVLMPSKPTIDVEIDLDHETIRGETVTVQAQAAGQKAAINQQITAQSIKNVVSSARIQELPDATAAESVGRLPGVSILRSGGEANKVAVRGLAPRFNNVQLEGVNMRSTDAQDRSTDISMISPSMLGGVEVTKALTPDMEANSLGGTINLTVREAPETTTYELLLQGGFDQQEESYDNYKVSASASSRFFEKNLGVYASAYIERRNRSTDVLNPDFKENFKLPEEERDESLLFDEIHFVDRSETRNRIGGSLVMDYRLENGFLKFTNFASRMDRDIQTHSQRYSGRDDYDLGWNMSDDGKYTMDQVINKLYGEFNVWSGKIDFRIFHSLGKRNQPNDRSVGGWGIYDMETELKDETYYLEYVNVLENRTTYMQSAGPSVSSYKSTEREIGIQANYEIPYRISNLATSSFKVGGLFKRMSREYDRENVRIPVTGNSYAKVEDYLLQSMPEVWVNRNIYGKIYVPDSWDDHFDNNLYFDGKYDLDPFMSWDIFNRMHEECFNYYERNDYIPERYTNSFTDDQDGYETTIATYVMTDIKMFNEKLSFIPGVRYEHVEYDYIGTHIKVPFGGSDRDWNEDNIDNVDTVTVNENWFPMVHLRLKPLNWFDVRLAYTQTASRPNYNHVVPYFIDNPNNKTIAGGNPYLKPQISENWDLYVSVYENKIGLLTMGLFHKNINDLIWTSTYLLTDTTEAKNFGVSPDYKGYEYTIPLNSKWESTLNGFEVEWQTHLWYIPSPFNNLVINANYTYMESETRYPWIIITKDMSTFPPTQVRIDSFYTGPIAGQPKQVINVSIGYDYKGFSGRLSYLYQDGSLNNINRKSYLNVYSFAYDRWDIKLRQKLPFSGLEFFLNLNNITDTADKSYRMRKFFIEHKERWGFTADAGLRLRI